MSQSFGEELLGNLSYERSKTWSSFFKNCLDKDDGNEFEFEELGELFQSEDEADNNDGIEEAKECEVKDDFNKSTQSLTNTELTLLLCHGDQSEILSQTLPIMEEHERKWKQAGLDRILNTFDADKIEEHVGGWLRRHKSSFANCSTGAPAATPAKRMGEVYTSSRSNDSDGESMHSMDTARYIRDSRKRNISTKSSTSLTTIKMYRTLPCKRAELRAKYACQADDLLEEQQHRRHMQALSQRRIHYSTHRGHCHSFTSVTFNGQQRRKMFRKRRYTSLVAAAASSSSSSDECECRKRCCSYRIYRYHSECHCRGQDCLPAPWMRGSGTMWTKRKTSSPVPNKMCRLENEELEDDCLSSPTELTPRYPASIKKRGDVSAFSSQEQALQLRLPKSQSKRKISEDYNSISENPINVSTKFEKSEQSQIRSLHTASSLNINQSAKATIFSPISQTDNEEIDSSENLINMKKKSEQTQIRSLHTASSLNINQSAKPTIFSPISQTDNEESDSSEKLLSMSRRLQKRKQSTPEQTNFNSPNVNMTTRSRASTSQQIMVDLQSAGSGSSINVRSRTKVKRKQLQRSLQVIEFDATTSSLPNQLQVMGAMSSTRSSAAKQENVSYGKKKCKQISIQEEINSNSLNSSLHANADAAARNSKFDIRDLQSDSSEDSSYMRRRTRERQDQSQRNSEIRDYNEAMSTKGTPATKQQSDISDNILNGSQRREEKGMDELTNSNSPIHANTDLLTRHPTPKFIELLSDSSEDSINVSIRRRKHSKSQQQVLDLVSEPQTAFVVTEKGILLHKPEADMNSSENGYDKFVLTANILSPIIGRRKASRFMKYHIGTCNYDARLHIYYRPSAKILAKLKGSALPGYLDSSSCSESEDVFEMFGRYGSIIESNS
ncbi:uncharacterized protein LOC133837203 [Drosophila sulfurigaster albostrigata]|uniref:uncharacterized protein LOC133837203 n=1 Tax=Drosophila sulfurigaster albostrigata TaxID=89887 RepID=UPI002D21C69C|nr:uncharacterized protein LOC133837203 [Drosophila sulfurigaster albostrigata]